MSNDCENKSETLEVKGKTGQALKIAGLLFNVMGVFILVMASLAHANRALYIEGFIYIFFGLSFYAFKSRFLSLIALLYVLLTSLEAAHSALQSGFSTNIHIFWALVYSIAFILLIIVSIRACLATFKYHAVLRKT